MSFHIKRPSLKEDFHELRNDFWELRSQFIEVCKLLGIGFEPGYDPAAHFIDKKRTKDEK